jgi:predicted DNA-binding transcriptional regulator AlpA
MHRENVITTPAIDPLLSDREVSALIGRARPTLQKDRLRGDGIPFVRIGRLVRYRRSDVERWFATGARLLRRVSMARSPAGVVAALSWQETLQIANSEMAKRLLCKAGRPASARLVPGALVKMFRSATGKTARQPETREVPTKNPAVWAGLNLS